MTETGDTDHNPTAPTLESTTYDELDRPELVTVHYVPGGDRTLESAYDRFGNRKSLVFTDGTDVMNHGWTYDKLNRLVEAELASPNPLEFTHFANDDLETITHGNGVVTEYAYWPEGPVQSITVESPSEQLLQLTYTINKVLNITGVNEQHAASGPVHAYSYGYDALDRLMSATYPTALGLPPSEAFAYDDAGNREDPAEPSAYAYDANNRITASPGKAWVYDGDGNPVSVNAGLGSEETFAHDAQNRMREYTSAATSTAASYLYDPFARRMKKTVNGVTTWFIWDGDQLLAEFVGSGERDRRYTYARGFAPAEQVVATGPSSEAVQPVHVDHLDTPRDLSGPSGSAVWRAAYHAFGTIITDEDPDGDLSDVRFAIRFPGQFADAESKFSYNRYRYYNSEVGRYLSGDPLGQIDDVNPFVYAGARPLYAVDPLGLAATVDKKCLACCLADVLANAGLGFIPGFNAARAAVQISGFDLQPCQYLGGYADPADLDALGAASGISSAFWAYLRALYAEAGGSDAQTRLRDLVSRPSFDGLGPRKQGRMLGRLTNLARLARLTALAGGVANLLNIGAALADAESQCGSGDLRRR